MDLKLYFHKVRTIEAAIAGEHAVVMSVETSDGGRPGQMSEVSRAVAAKLIAQGRARLASEEEIREFAAAAEKGRRAVEERSMKDRIQVSLMQAADLKLLRNAIKRED